VKRVLALHEASLSPDRALKPEWRALETVHAASDADVIISSPSNGWDFVATSRFRLGQLDVVVPPLGVPAFGVVYDAALEVRRKLQGTSVAGVGAPGHLAVLSPDVETRWSFDRPGEVVLVYISDELVRCACEENFDRDVRSLEIVPRFLIRDLTLERVAHQLLHELARPDPRGRLHIEMLAQSLAVHFLTSHSNLSNLTRTQACPMSPRRFARAKEFIEANLARDISLLELADAVNMSVFHFAKMFKEASGCAPHQYMTQRRMLEARSLLHRSTLSIAEVATAVGFQSRTHFAVLFHRHLGMSPREFRAVLRA
jgi:AraC family transcriptional regulator